MCENGGMQRAFVFLSLAALGAAGCSGSDKSGATQPPQDTGVDTTPPLPDPQCINLSLGLSRRVAGVPNGVQSIFTLTSHSVEQSPVPTGPSSLITQFTGGKLELDWLGTVDDGSDVHVTGGTLTIPADDPAPAGTFCVVSGTVWHKVATGGHIDFVVTDGDCTASSDAGAPSDAGDAASSEIMKGCLVYPAPPPTDAGVDASDADDSSTPTDASGGG
jgi:hypothetical protein